MRRMGAEPSSPEFWMMHVTPEARQASIFALRQGKPPGFDRDIFEYLTTGRGFGPQANPNCQHPLL